MLHDYFKGWKYVFREGESNVAYTNHVYRKLKLKIKDADRHTRNALIGLHVWFTTPLEVWQYLHSYSRITRLRKHDEAVRLLLLIRIHAEIYVVSYPIPVVGRHIWFNTYPDVEQC